MQAYSRETGLVLTSYGTLGSPGRSSVANEQGCVIPSVLTNPVVVFMAQALGRTPAQVMLRYFVQQGIGVIPKSVTPARIQENSQLFGWSLSEACMAALRSLDKGEAGRSFNFSSRRGFELHPEYPFPCTPHTR
ncbi:aldo-keto reductase family 1 member B7 [Hyalella azteca]|uniref:Aldo-keto reductase family 1 member B7 n=1 Tax=Hyalella azteca TaxID=294128 RepID=A0A8B7PQ33_HYAAZ|nr:aldo-keto reductase family 1 member B7 [Hyalella azteca]